MPRKSRASKTTMHGPRGRHWQRTQLKWDTTGTLPSYHFLAARQLNHLTQSPYQLREILHVDGRAAQSMLGRDPAFRAAYGEYLVSRWGQKPENHPLIAACADQEHPIYTPRPHHLWLLHGVFGGQHLAFTSYCTLVFHAQFERWQSTRYVKNSTFTDDYLAVLSLIALADPNSAFASLRFSVSAVRRWNGVEFRVQPAFEYNFSLNEYRAALGARLRRGDMMGMRGEVLEIAQSILLAI